MQKCCSGLRNQRIAVVANSFGLFALLILFSELLSVFGFGITSQTKELSVELILSAGVSAPLIETILFQMVPIELCNIYNWSRRSQIIVSSMLFASAHANTGINIAVSVGLVGGAYLSILFTRFTLSQRWGAIIVTACVHALANIQLLALAHFLTAQ